MDSEQAVLKPEWLERKGSFERNSNRAPGRSELVNETQRWNEDDRSAGFQRRQDPARWRGDPAHDRWGDAGNNRYTEGYNPGAGERWGPIRDEQQRPPFHGRGRGLPSDADWKIRMKEGSEWRNGPGIPGPDAPGSAAKPAWRADNRGSSDRWGPSGGGAPRANDGWRGVSHRDPQRQDSFPLENRGRGRGAPSSVFFKTYGPGPTSSHWTSTDRKRYPTDTIWRVYRSMLYSQKLKLPSVVERDDPLLFLADGDFVDVVEQFTGVSPQVAAQLFTEHYALLAKTYARGHMRVTDAAFSQSSSQLYSSSDGSKPEGGGSKEQKTVEEDAWVYKDPNGVLQGPFAKQDIIEWHEAGYFPMTLMLRNAAASDETAFRSLEDMLRVWGASKPTPPGFTATTTALEEPLEPEAPKPVDASLPDDLLSELPLEVENLNLGFEPAAAPTLQQQQEQQQQQYQQFQQQQQQQAQAGGINPASLLPHAMGGVDPVVDHTILKQTAAFAALQSHHQQQHVLSPVHQHQMQQQQQQQPFGLPSMPGFGELPGQLHHHHPHNVPMPQFHDQQQQHGMMSPPPVGQQQQQHPQDFPPMSHAPKVAMDTVLPHHHHHHHHHPHPPHPHHFHHPHAAHPQQQQHGAWGALGGDLGASGMPTEQHAGALLAMQQQQQQRLSLDQQQHDAAAGFHPAHPPHPAGMSEGQQQQQAYEVLPLPEQQPPARARPETKPAPWAGAPPPAKSLKDIQMEEAEKERKAKEEEAAMIRAQGPPSSAGPWAKVAARGGPPVVSLQDIQQEEQRNKAGSSGGDDGMFWEYGEDVGRGPPPPPPPPQQPPRPLPPPPAEKKTGWAAAAASGIPQQPSAAAIMSAPAVTRPPPPPPPPGAPRANGGMAPSSQIQSQTVTLSDVDTYDGNGDVGDGGSGALTGPFRAWCVEQMEALSGSRDVTLCEFLMTVESNSEIAEYIATYLGNSPDVGRFSSEFLRRKLAEQAVPVKKSRKARAKANAAAAAAAAATASATRTASNAAANAPQPGWEKVAGAGKKKKGKAADANLTGFTSGTDYSVLPES